ncbi:unnamed protein product [Rhizoctonia solani]|uniref:Uncharacterized protein n=1 Tax=Rhizoctonia solani TaxID=456999 RepID=A0A8H3C196_9AGAM|nr:unnamed protein product [Rhizoctonia solani]
MTLPDTVQTRLSALEKRLAKCKRQLERLQRAEKLDQHEKVRDEEFIGILKDTCALVREAELSDAPYLVELAKAADKILDDGIGYSYGRDDDPSESEEGLYDFMPSWAHDDAGDRPLITDESGGKFPLPHAALESFMRIFQSRLGGGTTDLTEFTTEAWNPASKRHPKSTNLSRFRSKLPPLTPTINKPLAASVLDARCEISSSRCSAPIRFLTSLGGTCLALTGMGGYKNRSPTLEYFILNQSLAPYTNFPAGHRYEPGLASVAFHGVIDEARRLIFVGDDDRIKSYEWGSPTEVYPEPSPVHTLDTELSKGPMMILPNGSVVRAGKGGASVYDVRSLPTHGEDGDEVIGEEIEDFDTMCDDPEEIEPSSGSAPTSHIKFFDQPEFKPHIWQPLISAPSTVICAEYAREGGKYSCTGIDLETGKTTSYYLGHGADVSAFSVSQSDPQLFLSACNDGFARLFDSRRPLPVVTFDACGQDEFCEAAALAHPDSIPIVFTGTHKGEQIKVWDVRARACVYELATGNNAVQSLAWDALNNCLYAATECEYMDRLGSHHDYRYAKIPKNQRGQIEGLEEDEEWDDEDDQDPDRCLPSRAWHKEDYFGYLFDSGDHRIIRYAFKEDPNPSVMPEYGDATVHSDRW